MGSLKPGATYIYESPDGGETVYARESGHSERTMIGQSLHARSKLDDLKEDKLWGEIRRAAKSNKALQEALERAIIIYHLSKEDKND
jgi:hypothetical protein